MTMMKNSHAPLALGAAVLLGLLASCAPVATDNAATETEDVTNQTAPSIERSPSDTSWLLIDGSPESDIQAQVAWFALMSPDGEYAAAASYQAVIDAFGPVEPYATIKEGEDRHIDALIRQLNRLGYEAPANPYLGEIEAPADLQTAAEAWAVGEIANVEMYDDLLAIAGDSNIERVLTNLRRASLESHLPLFELAAQNGGTLELDQMMQYR
jgi:hypothetical protein